MNVSKGLVLALAVWLAPACGTTAPDRPPTPNAELQDKAVVTDGKGTPPAKQAKQAVTDEPTAKQPPAAEETGAEKAQAKPAAGDQKEPGKTAGNPQAADKPQAAGDQAGGDGTGSGKSAGERPAADETGGAAPAGGAKPATTGADGTQPAKDGAGPEKGKGAAAGKGGDPEAKTSTETGGYEIYVPKPEGRPEDYGKPKGDAPSLFISVPLFFLHLAPNIVADTLGLFLNPIVKSFHGQEVKGDWIIVTLASPLVGPFMGIRDSYNLRPFWRSSAWCGAHEQWCRREHVTEYQD